MRNAVFLVFRLARLSGHRWLACMGGMLLAFALCPQPAHAHKVNVFAYAEGETLHGEVYARGGEAVREARVEIFDPAGEKLGETTTDATGKFTWEAQRRCDHRLVVDGGSGHAAEFTLSADELPDTLPRPADVAISMTPTAPIPTSSVSEPAPTSQPDIEPASKTERAESGQSLHEQLASLNRQVVQLRRELNEFQQTLRFRDILGALGYIMGLAGMAFYFLGVKKRVSS